MIKALNRIDRGLMLVASVTLIVMMLITAVSVLGRYFFLMPIPDDVTANELLLVVVAFLPLGLVQARREHIMVNVFTEWMSRRAKATLDTFGLFVGAAIFSFVAWASVESFLRAAESGAYIEGLLNLPESPARLALAVGIGIFTLRLIVNCLRNLVGLAADRPELLGPDVEVPWDASFEHSAPEREGAEGGGRAGSRRER